MKTPLKTTTCAYKPCGVLFQQTRGGRGNGKGSVRKYCSADCRISQFVANRKERIKPLEKCKCKRGACAAIFTQKDPKQLYCSVSCRNKGVGERRARGAKYLAWHARFKLTEKYRLSHVLSNRRLTEKGYWRLRRMRDNAAISESQLKLAIVGLKAKAISPKTPVSSRPALCPDRL